MSTSPQPTPSADIGAILSQSLNLYLGRFAQYILIPVVVLLPAYIINAIIREISWRAAFGAMTYAGWGGLGAIAGGSVLVSLLSGLVQWTAFGFCIGLLAKVVEGHLAGKTVSLGEAFRSVPVGALAVTAVLFGLATAIGWILLVLSGLAVWFFGCLAFPVAALDKESPINAFTRSVKAVLKVPAEVIIVLVIFLVYFLVAGVIAAAFVFSGTVFLVPMLTGIFLLFVTPWLAAALSLCYDRAKKLGA